MPDSAEYFRRNESGNLTYDTAAASLYLQGMSLFAYADMAYDIPPPKGLTEEELDIYRETVDYKQIEKLNIWLNNLPANGTTKVYLSPIRALPLVKARIRNSRLTIGDLTLLLPVEMESGSYLEFNAADDCKVFGPDGSFLQEVKINGPTPALASGVNQLRFTCDISSSVNPRVRITTATLGESLAP